MITLTDLLEASCMGYRSTVTARTDGITLACRQTLSAMVWTQDIRANVTCSSGSSISLWKGIQGTFLCIPSKLSLSILSSNLDISKLNPLEVVSHHRDPQLQEGENYSYLSNFRPSICKS